MLLWYVLLTMSWMPSAMQSPSPDVLQSFYSNVRDADAVRHEVCLNEHFVTVPLHASFVNSAKSVELIVLCQVYVSLGNSYLFAYLELGFGYHLVSVIDVELASVRSFQAETAAAETLKRSLVADLLSASSPF